MVALERRKNIYTNVYFMKKKIHTLCCLKNALDALNPKFIILSSMIFIFHSILSLPSGEAIGTDK